MGCTALIRRAAWELGAAWLVIALPVSAQHAAPATAVSVAPAIRYLSAAQKADIDAYVERAMHDWGDVPGLSLAIVQGDSLVYARGYGVREKGKPVVVDEHTLFAIGSNTKSMTSAVIAMLVDEGKMRYDAPVWTYLPSFRLADPYVSREATIRDLLAHRVDVENNLSAWYRSPYTRAQLVARLRFLKQEASFRSAFLYNNLMYLTAGEAGAAVAGTSWNALVRERLFTPLHMTSSVTNSRELPASGNIAMPHTLFNGTLVAIPHVDADNIGPAGSVYSNAVDMAQYLRLQLGNGVYRGTRLISVLAMSQVRAIANPIGPFVAAVADSDNVTLGYGLGWLVESFRGHRRVRHNGSIDGYLAEMQVLPDDRLGVVVLSNQMARPVPEAVANHVLDVVLGLRPRDWHGEARARAKAQEAALAARTAAAPRPAGGAPLLPLERYVGTFTDSLRGTVTITPDSGHLVFTFHPGLVAVMEPWQYNTFRLAWRAPNVYASSQGTLVTFEVDAAGKVVSLTGNLLGTFRATPPAASRTSGGHP